MEFLFRKFIQSFARNKKYIEGARRQISGLSNQSAFQENNKSDRPIRLLWQDQQVVRTNQSSSTDHLSKSTNQNSSMDHLFVWANQIAWTDHLSVSTNQIARTDHLSVLSNQILPTDHLSYRPIRSLGRTIFPYRPIRSLGESPAEITKRSSHLYGHGPHELTRARSPTLKPTRHSNNLRSHERDSRNLRKKSPCAKAVQSRTR